MKTHCRHGHTMEVIINRNGDSRPMCRTCLRNGSMESRRVDLAQCGEVSCACGCGAIIKQAASNQKWLNKAHAQRVQYARNVIEKTGKPPVPQVRGGMRPKTRYIREAVADTEPGKCPWCDEKLPGTRRTKCGERECLRAYNRAYRAGRVEWEKAQRPTGELPLCACGCGERLTQKVGKQKYLNRTHERRANDAKRRKPQVGKWQRLTGKAPPAQRFHFASAPKGKKIIRPFAR